jgi:hypothetical protein
MRILLLSFVILTSTASLCAKPWRGIEPMRSTRSDVIRTLNQCSDQKEACVFNLGNEDVYILFSAGLTSNYSDCTERLPPETVMFIDIRPYSVAEFKDFQFAKREFVESSLVGSWRTKQPVQYHLYVNSKEGLALKTRERAVVQVVYLPPSSEVHKCPDYYDPLESFVGVFYGHVPIANTVCPQTPLFEGQQITAGASSNLATRRGYEWIISDGKIVAGQHTFSITIDTTGLAGKSIKIQAEKHDYDLGLTVSSTCELTVSKRP